MEKNKALLLALYCAARELPFPQFQAHAATLLGKIVGAVRDRNERSVAATVMCGLSASGAVPGSSAYGEEEEDGDVMASLLHSFEAGMINGLLWEEMARQACPDAPAAAAHGATSVAARSADRQPLTSAERRTAELAATGLSYKEVAAQLHLSPATVRNQLHSTYQKLGVRNRTALSRQLISTP